MEATLVVNAIQRAVRRCNPPSGLCFHSDRGVQYGSHAVRQTMRAISVRQSMSGKGNCYDNAFAESLFSTIKAECFPANQVFETRKEADNALFEYIEVYYNNRRLHSSLGYLTPEGFEIKYKTLLASTHSTSQRTGDDGEDRAMRGRNSSTHPASVPNGSLPASPSG
jgi:transposase InsO family protein